MGHPCGNYPCPNPGPHSRWLTRRSTGRLRRRLASTLGYPSTREEEEVFWKNKKTITGNFRDDPSAVMYFMEHVFIYMRGYVKDDPDSMYWLADALHNVGKWINKTDPHFTAEDLETHLEWYFQKFPEKENMIRSWIKNSRKQSIASNKPNK